MNVLHRFVVHQICFTNLMPSAFALALFVIASSANAQQTQSTPSPAPPRTGRAYSGAELSKTPPPSTPQAPSTVTFTDITSQTGINFKHAASFTSQKYLLESMG